LLTSEARPPLFHASCVKVNDAAYNVLKELDLPLVLPAMYRLKLGKVIPSIVKTSGSAMAEGPRDALVSTNSATTKYPYRIALFA